MNQRRPLFFWVILLLVGMGFVIPDAAEETPALFGASTVAVIDADDVDDPDDSRTFALLAHAELSLLPLGILFPRLVLFGRLQPPTQSTAPEFLLRSLRTPRSPTSN